MFHVEHFADPEFPQAECDFRVGNAIPPAQGCPSPSDLWTGKGYPLLEQNVPRGTFLLARPKDRRYFPGLNSNQEF